MLICGPKSSGKSTFTKLLSNRLLSAVAERTAASASRNQKSSGVAILDLDPGQPEYFVPGQLSLMHIQEPNFGPAFSHPIPYGKNRSVRAHTIAAITPSMDPSLYMACALDLFAHYQILLSTIPDCPLIINTPGWVLGTGLEILLGLITKIRPTEVIYMSQKGPHEVVESLREAAKATPVFTLPSQVSEYVTRTAAHLRSMQAISYLHVNHIIEDGLTWNTQPLTSIPPWEVRYSGENAGILGVMCYGEQPPPDLLLDSINGALVGIVIIEDAAAIPGWQADEENAMDEDKTSPSDQPCPMDTEDTELRAFGDQYVQSQHLEKPLIVRTPKEELPYFNPANSISLDPKHSQCIGLALIRGIDINRRRLQVITPISPKIFEQINEGGKSIVLVSGKYDTPGWAYTEELMQKQSLEKAAKHQTDDGLDLGEEDDEDEEGGDVEDRLKGRSLGEGFHNAPWIEQQEGSQGRAVGSRVWRVRRDLGKSGD
jgi:polynucleotide 5'-hydroxyl-kinase GRC3/NOL9